MTLREVAAFDLILTSRESSVRETVESIADRERIVLQTRYDTNFWPTALGLVRSGLGVTILPESAAGKETAEFARIPLRDRFSSRQIELLQRRDMTLSPAAESFARHLQHSLDAEQPAARETTKGKRKAR